MNLILDTNHKKVHRDSCKLLKEHVKLEHQRKIIDESEIPEHYVECKACDPKKNHDKIKWGAIL